MKKFPSSEGNWFLLPLYTKFIENSSRTGLRLRVKDDEKGIHMNVSSFSTFPPPKVIDNGWLESGKAAGLVRFYDLTTILSTNG